MVLGFSLDSLERDRMIPVHSIQSEKTLKEFPNSLRGAPGDLLLEIPAVHPALGKPINQDAYWWVDCKFVPFDNTRLIVSAGAYTLRPGRTWVPCQGIKPGLITSWLLKSKEEVLVCGVLKGITTSSRPQIQLYPDGEYIGFVGNRFVRVLDVAANDRYKIYDRTVSHKHCAFSPDGTSIAVLCKRLCQFELEISSLDSRFRRINIIDCHKMCPQFKGTFRNTEHVECKFSPDNKLVALSHSRGILFTVEFTVTTSDLKLHCKIFPGLVMDTLLANERSYDFHPSCQCTVLAAGGKDGKLYICDIKKQEILHRELFLDDTESFDCLKFSPNGDQLAIANSNFTIALLSTKTRQVVCRLENIDKCPNLIEQPSTGRLPEVTSMCFDCAGQRLVVASSDGKIRIWQLSAAMDLQYLCKLQIQQHCSTKAIKKLPLRSSLITFLLHRLITNDYLHNPML